MNPKCDVCGVVGAEGQVFVSEAVPFCKRKSYCPNCHSRLYQRVFLVIYGFALLIGVWGFILLLRNPHSENGRLLLNLLLLQLLFVVLIVPHELGHALGARLVGFKVDRILLGFGKRFFSFRLLGFQTEVNRVPMGGLCFAQPVTVRVPLWKYFVFVAAGPLANLVLGWGCWWLFVKDYSVTKSLASLASATPAALFVTANVLGLMENLFPWVVKTPSGESPSDGMALWQILVERRVPYVPPPKMPRVTVASRLIAVLQWIVALVIAGVGIFVGVGGCRWMYGQRDGSMSVVDPWTGLGMLVLALFGLTLVWLAWRIGTHRSPSRDVAQMHGILLVQEAAAQSSQEHQAFIAKIIEQQQALEKKGDSVGALAAIEEGLAELPNEVLFLMMKATNPTFRQTPGATAELCERMLRNFEWSPISRALLLTDRSCLLMSAGEVVLSKQLIEECLALSLPPESKAELSDHAATQTLSSQVKELWEDAVRWINSAIQLQPQKLTLKGTKGSLLVELGQNEEGERLLREVCAGSQEKTDQGISLLYLAVVAKRKGNWDEARTFAGRAAHLCPQPWILSRIRQEFPEARESAGKE